MTVTAEQQAARQEIFNTVYAFYRAGGKPGYDAETEICVYKAADGGRCAIGVVAEARGFLDEIAGISTGVETLSHRKIGNPNIIRLEEEVGGIEFLGGLQGAHDCCEGEGEGATPEDICASLRDVAKRYNLEVPK